MCLKITIFMSTITIFIGSIRKVGKNVKKRLGLSGWKLTAELFQEFPMENT